MYAQRYFTPEDKEQLFEMTQYLRKAFSGMLDDLDWMDESTRVNIRGIFSFSTITFLDELRNPQLCLLSARPLNL